VIGRTGPVRPFELIRWARQQARAHGLRPLEAHVLLLLATYANEDAQAWPSVAALAMDAGLAVTRRPNRPPSNSSVSAALVRLEELQLIWRRQAGRGPARTELLFNPTAAVPASGVQEGYGPVRPSAPGPFALRQAGAEASGRQEVKCQKNGHEGTARTSTPERPDDGLRQAGGRRTPASERLRRRPAPRPLAAALSDFGLHEAIGASA
jgi:hypothetical protein